MAIFAVEYTYDPAKDETIAEVRPTHRAWLAGLFEQGTLKASGPLVGVEPGGALIIVEAESSDDALGLLEADPFFAAGVITKRSARAWNPVIGPRA